MLLEFQVVQNKNNLSDQIKKNKIDFVVVNGENAEKLV